MFNKPVIPREGRRSRIYQDGESRYGDPWIAWSSRAMTMLNNSTSLLKRQAANTYGRCRYEIPGDCSFLSELDIRDDSIRRGNIFYRGVRPSSVPHSGLSLAKSKNRVFNSVLSVRDCGFRDRLHRLDFFRVRSSRGQFTAIVDCLAAYGNLLLCLNRSGGRFSSGKSAFPKR